MKKTLVLILTVGTLVLTSMSVFATEKTPISTGDIEIITPENNKQETFDWEVNNGRFRGGCNLDECDTYGECGDYVNCLNAPGRDNLQTNRMSTYNSGRSCCR